MPRSFFAEAQIATSDGETFTLVCDFFAIDVIEQIVEERFDDILPKLISPPRALAVKVLYGLLRKRHDTITLDQAAAISFDKNSLAIWATMGDVIRRAVNFDDEEEESPSKPKGKNPPSARRGRSRVLEKSG